MSNDVSSSSSFSISETRGFKGVATSSAMTKFSLASTKTKEGSRNNGVLAFRRGRGFFV